MRSRLFAWIVAVLGVAASAVVLRAQQPPSVAEIDALAAERDGLPRWRSLPADFDAADWCQRCADEAPPGARGVSGRGYLGELPALGHGPGVAIEVYRWHGHGADVGALDFPALLASVEFATGLALHASTPGVAVDGSLTAGGGNTAWLALYTQDAVSRRAVSPAARLAAQAAFRARVEAWAGRAGTAAVRPR